MLKKIQKRNQKSIINKHLTDTYNRCINITKITKNCSQTFPSLKVSSMKVMKENQIGWRKHLVRFIALCFFAAGAGMYFAARDVYGNIGFQDRIFQYSFGLIMVANVLMFASLFIHNWEARTGRREVKLQVSSYKQGN